MNTSPAGTEQSVNPQFVIAGDPLGESLTEKDLEHLEASWINRELAERTCRRVNDLDGSNLFKGKPGRAYSGILFSYFLPGETKPCSFRLRLDHPSLKTDGNPGQRYMAAQESRNRLYCIPGLSPEECKDTSLPVAITEGEKKALALFRLAGHETNSPRFLVLGIAGVYGWRGRCGRSNDETGARVDVEGPIPDLDLIAWEKRKVFIVFDNDIYSNPYVKGARRGLTKELSGRGAEVFLVDLPASNEKLGVDDCLAQFGPDAVLKLFEQAQAYIVFPRYEVMETGVWWKDDNPKIEDRSDIWLCSKLDVVALTRDSNGKDWGRLLKWRDADYRAHVWAMPIELVAGDGSEYRRRLLSEGLSVSPNKKAREKLTEYLQETKPSRRVRSVARVGWHGESFVLPESIVGPLLAGEEVIYQTPYELEHHYRESGTLEEWRDKVSRFCPGNSRLVFALSVAFAGPLLSLVSEESGGFHFNGTSSIGKTTALFVAGSVWGGGGRLGFAHSWKATANGLETIAELHNDGFLGLDEINLVDAREAGGIAYMVASGVGKDRATKTMSQRRRLSWSLLFLSSGEYSLADHMRQAGKRSRGGQEVRLLDLPADAGKGLGLFEHLHNLSSGDEFSRMLSTNAKAYYGTAALAFLGFLTQNKIEAQKGVRRFRESFISENTPSSASGEVSRAAGRFALVAAAGEIVTEAGVTGWKEGEAIKAASTMFQAWMEQRSTKPTDEDAAIRQVRAFLEAHGQSRFQSLKPRRDKEGEIIPERILNRAGFRAESETEEATDFLILPTVFNDEVCQGYGSRMVIKALLDRGYLEMDGDGKSSVRRNLPEYGRKRVYLVKSRIFEE